MSVRVTVDTNVLDEERVSRIREAAAGRDVEIAFTTVTERERPGSVAEFVLSDPVRETMVWGESRWGEAVWGGPVYETLTLGESRLGMAALGSDESPSRFEGILRVIGSGSFPRRRRVFRVVVDPHAGARRSRSIRRCAESQANLILVHTVRADKAS